MKPYSDDNIFRKIIDKENDDCIAILDKFPVVPGHSLLITKSKVSNLLTSTGDEAAKLFYHLPRLCRAVMKATKANGITTVVNNEKASGQIVFQTHIHVIPRYDNDRLIDYDRSLRNFSDFLPILEQIKSEFQISNS